MTTYSWPASLGAASMEWGLSRAVMRHTSPFTKQSQTIDLLAWQWLVNVTVPSRNLKLAGAIEAFMNTLVGGVDLVTLHHLARPLPYGTMRGTPTLLTGAAQFAASITIQTVAGATVKSGDMLGVAGQLLQARTDAVANGSGELVVPLAARLSASVASGAAVIWDKPTAVFYLVDQQSSLAYTPGRLGPTAFQLAQKVV